MTVQRVTTHTHTHTHRTRFTAAATQFRDFDVQVQIHAFGLAPARVFSCLSFTMHLCTCCSLYSQPMRGAVCCACSVKGLTTTCTGPRTVSARTHATKNWNYNRQKNSESLPKNNSFSWTHTMKDTEFTLNASCNMAVGANNVTLHLWEIHSDPMTHPKSDPHSKVSLPGSDTSRVRHTEHAHPETQTDVWPGRT